VSFSCFLWCWKRPEFWFCHLSGNHVLYGLFVFAIQNWPSAIMPACYSLLAKQPVRTNLYWTRYNLHRHVVTFWSPWFLHIYIFNHNVTLTMYVKWTANAGYNPPPPFSLLFISGFSFLFLPVRSLSFPCSCLPCLKCRTPWTDPGNGDHPNSVSSLGGSGQSPSHSPI